MSDNDIDITTQATKAAEHIKKVTTAPGTLDKTAEGRVTLGLIELSNAIRANNFAKGWRSEGAAPRPIGDLAALLHSEVTEAFEAFRNNEPDLWYEYSVPGFVGEPFNNMPSILVDGQVQMGKPQGVASELADVIIRVLDWADEHELPLVQAILDKHRFNLTRPYRHGGKAV